MFESGMKFHYIFVADAKYIKVADRWILAIN